jgi:hypothetical protein
MVYATDATQCAGDIRVFREGIQERGELNALLRHSRLRIRTLPQRFKEVLSKAIMVP